MKLNAILTTREKEVGMCLVHGMTAKEVSRQLAISVHTVEGYQRTIKRKLKAKTPYHIGCMLGKALEADLSERIEKSSIPPRT